MHQYYCERPPVHVAKATWRVKVVMDDKGRTQVVHLCSQCYAYYCERMVIAKEEPILSVDDWTRILEKNYLDRQWLDDLRILAIHEIGRKRHVFCVHVAERYRLLFPDVELLAPLPPDKIRNDEDMEQWSGGIAKVWGAMLGLTT